MLEHCSCGPQTKFAKAMFSQVSVCPQGGGSQSLSGGLCPGGSLSGRPPRQRPSQTENPPGQRAPLDRDPPGQRDPPWQRPTLDRYPPRQRPPWTETPGQRPPWTVTGGRYASYWNAFLFYTYTQRCNKRSKGDCGERLSNRRKIRM